MLRIVNNLYYNTQDSGGTKACPCMSTSMGRRWFAHEDELEALNSWMAVRAAADCLQWCCHESDGQPAWVM
jgi:hypothetical protein